MSHRGSRSANVASEAVPPKEIGQRHWRPNSDGSMSVLPWIADGAEQVAERDGQAVVAQPGESSAAVAEYGGDVAVAAGGCGGTPSPKMARCRSYLR